MLRTFALPLVVSTILLALSTAPAALAQEEPVTVRDENVSLVVLEGRLRPEPMQRRVDPPPPPEALEWDAIRRMYELIPALEGIDLPARPKRFTLSPDHPVERPYGGYLNSANSWIHASNAPYDWRFPTVALNCSEDLDQVSVVLTQLAADTRYALDFSLQTHNDYDFLIRSSGGDVSYHTRRGDQHLVTDVRTSSRGGGWVALNCEEDEGPWYFYEVTIYEIGAAP